MASHSEHYFRCGIDKLEVNFYKKRRVTANTGIGLAEGIIENEI